MSAKNKKKPLRKNTKRKDPRQKIAWPDIRLKPLLVFSGWALALGSLMFVLILVYSLITHTTVFAAKSIQVTGFSRLNEQTVLSQAGIHKGDNIFNVNLSVARERLLAHPWIDQADVSRDIPDGIRISIVEHKLLAYVDLGKRYLMNTNGKIFKHFSGETDVVPMITGFSPEDIHVAGRHPMKHETNPHKAVMNIVKLAQKPGSRISFGRVKEILVDRETGLTLSTDGPFRHIQLGYGQYEEKIERMVEVSTFLEQKADLHDLDSIDLNNINRVVVKPQAEEAQV